MTTNNLNGKDVLGFVGSFTSANTPGSVTASSRGSSSGIDPEMFDSEEGHSFRPDQLHMVS